MKPTKYLFGLAAAALAVSAHAGPFSEGFDSVANLAAAGWLQVNNSAVPANPWFQGNSGIFAAQAGAADSYAGADFLSSDSGTIDNWLISPILAIDAGSVLSFYTKSAGTKGFADQLGVYFSATGGTAVSDFVLLGSIGAGNYPLGWTQYSFDLSPSATGRFAFRQGGTADTADYLGIDTVSVAAVTNPIPEPSTYALMALGIAAVAVVRRRQRAA